MKLTNPVEPKYKITSKFGKRIIDGKEEFHNGIDFGCPIKSYVYACHRGLVTKIWYDERGGLSLRYQLYSEYEEVKNFIIGIAHLGEVLVGPGDYIERGQPIALTGNTGRLRGNCLHLTLRKDGEPVDPEPYFL